VVLAMRDIEFVSAAKHVKIYAAGGAFVSSISRQLESRLDPASFVRCTLNLVNVEHSRDASCSRRLRVVLKRVHA